MTIPMWPDLPPSRPPPALTDDLAAEAIDYYRRNHHRAPTLPELWAYPSRRDTLTATLDSLDTVGSKFTLGTAARVLNVSTAELDRMARDGQIAFTQIDGHPMVDEGDLNRALTEQAGVDTRVSFENLRLFSMTAVADRLSISVSSVHLMFKSNTLGYVKVGTRKMVPADELARYIDEIKAEAVAAGTFPAAARK